MSMEVNAAVAIMIEITGRHMWFESTSEHVH